MIRINKIRIHKIFVSVKHLNELNEHLNELNEKFT